MWTKGIDVKVKSWKLELISCTNQADSTDWFKSFYNLQTYLRILY